MSAEKASQVHPIIAFRAEPDLHAWADGQAAMEGISRSDVARRALIRDRQRGEAKEATGVSFSLDDLRHRRDPA
jgi:hypothetical protein